VIPFACPAPFIHDGDNIECAGGGEMRLARIDAPELAESPRCRGAARAYADCDQRRAIAARDNLRRLVAGGPVSCTVVDADPRVRGFQSTDRYGRAVVRCRVNGIDLSDAQLRGGYAIPWPKPRKRP
jgi:endonuclease YncB( thermonuclease family)